MEIKDIFKRAKKIHIVGIGGISMSAIAKMLMHKGYIVSGSDAKKSTYTQQLEMLGVKIHIGHRKTNVPKDADIVVYSLSIKQDNPELKQSKALNIMQLKRGEILGLLSQEYKHVIAVSGMHGKTTTTAMIYSIFKECGKNPTLHIGGEIDGVNKNLVLGEDDYFITEACEYGDSFLSLHPEVSIINNVEKEHLDYFKNLNNIYKSFNRFMLQSKVCYLNACLKSKLINFDQNYYGAGGYVRAKNIKKCKVGCVFDAWFGDEFYGKVRLNIEGKHNVHNCLGALCVAKFYSLNKDKVLRGIEKFSGVKMRFESVGKYDDHDVIFDYAHHPTEIKSSIKTALSLGKNKVYVYFQPHTYSRTKMLKTQFKKCFKGAESVFVCSTYKAREKYDFAGDEKVLAELIKSEISTVNYGNIEAILEDIKSKNEKGILLFMGAGDMQSKIKQRLFGLK